MDTAVRLLEASWLSLLILLSLFVVCFAVGFLVGYAVSGSRDATKAHKVGNRQLPNVLALTFFAGLVLTIALSYIPGDVAEPTFASTYVLVLGFSFLRSLVSVVFFAACGYVLGWLLARVAFEPG